MKLATLNNGSRDGKLVLVSSDLAYCTDVSNISPTLQYAFDHWPEIAPKLKNAANSLASESLPMERFREREAMSPLPRAYQWLDGSAYVNHVELLRLARGEKMPDSFWTSPLMYQRACYGFCGPRDPILLPNDSGEIDMKAAVAVIISDVPMGVSIEHAADKIQLIMLVNDVSLHGSQATELEDGFAFSQSQPSTAFSPVAVTPAELGDTWDGRKLKLPLHVDVNNQPFGRANTGIDMTFDFAQLIAHAAKSRALESGTIISSGTVSNKLDGKPGKTIAAGGSGFSCITELRMVETLASGKPTTPYLQFDDEVRIEMIDSKGHSILGAIKQTVKQYHSADTG